MMGDALDAACRLMHGPIAPQNDDAVALREVLAHTTIMGARLGETSTLALAHAAVRRLRGV